mgnify:FL=1
MKTLKIDDNNNLVISQNNLQIIDGIDACAQDTKTRVGLVMGENPSDITEGIDFYNEVLGKLGGTDYILEAVRKRILANTEIVNVNSLNFVKKDNSLILTAKISTIYGVMEL